MILFHRHGHSLMLLLLFHGLLFHLLLLSYSALLHHVLLLLLLLHLHLLLLLLIRGLVLLLLLQHRRSLLMFQAGCILLLHHAVRHLLSLHTCWCWWLLNILLSWRRQHCLLFTCRLLWLGQILIILTAVLGYVGLHDGQLLVEMIVRIS